MSRLISFLLVALLFCHKFSATIVHPNFLNNVKLNPIVAFDNDNDGVLDITDLDDDNDGVLDTDEQASIVIATDPCDDDNADLILNYQDPTYCTLNAMNVCTLLDLDGDGIINQFDLDSDNDGLPDLIEAGGVDLNGDGLVDGFADADADGLANFYDVGSGGFAIANLDIDGDGVANFLDFDSDGDGIQDVIETGLIDANGDGQLDGFVDADLNGFNDTQQTTPEITTGADTNADGIPNSYAAAGVADDDLDNDSFLNYWDLDSDNDGISDAGESNYLDPDVDGVAGTFGDPDADGDGWIDAIDDGTHNTAYYPNSDGLGSANFADLDSDNDGTPDLIEAGGTDMNGNGVVDAFADINSNGWPDAYDPAVSGFAINIYDTDGDGVPDHQDLDSDGDGIQDIIEVGAADANGDGMVDGFTDANFNGFDDVLEASPTSATGADSNGDGIPNSVPTSGITDNDFDNDGIINTIDIDSDDDGISDLVEAGYGAEDIDFDAVFTSGDTNGGDVDNDGWADFTDDGAHTSATILNTDASNGADFLDIDSDNDGIVDNIEAQFSVGISSGYIAQSYGDANGNGLDNAYEIAGIVGLQPIDDADDADAIPDYLDLNSDEDTETDAVEAYDTDGSNTINGAELAFAAADADADGLVDVYDLDDVNFNPSNQTVPLTGGQTSNSFPMNDGGPDRDWRNVAGNMAPVVVTENFSTFVNISLNGDVSPNDTDVDGPAPLTFTILTPPNAADGSIMMNTDGTFTFTPTPGFTGFVTFDYQACDAFGVPACANIVDTIFVTALPLVDTDADGIDDLNDLDDDNDGIRDTEENSTAGNPSDVSGDDDFDGTLNYQDPDYCTLNLTGVCTDLDFDGDGVIDQFDLDSDNDGIPDLIEAGGVDTDGNGLVDAFVDTDNNGLTDVYDDLNGGVLIPNSNTDGDGFTNSEDIDADGDGTQDIVEAGIADANGDGILDAFVDANLNGFDDVMEATPDAATGNDTDADGLPDSWPLVGITDDDFDNDTIPNWIDIDSDNDAINDAIEGGFTDPDVDGIAGSFGDPDSDNDGWVDAIDDGTHTSASILNTDGDSNPNYHDLDSDNDATPDLIEAGGVDTDGDGLTDSFADLNENGLADVYDINNGGNAIILFDIDGDLISDYLDLDSDNDGIQDIIETGDIDTDGNGTIDSFVDANADGFDDNIQAVPTSATGADTDADGAPNSNPISGLTDNDFDNDGYNNQIDLDSDNDGLSDVIEAGFTDNDADGIVGLSPITDSNNNGWSDLGDGVLTSVSIPNADALVGPNFIDLDADNDGTPDLIEASGVDTDGNGIVDLLSDGDGDGIQDTYDVNDGGVSISNEDVDGDGINNYVDLDSDNDGIQDLIEAGEPDADANGMVDSFADADNTGYDDLLEATPTSATGADTDADGVPNSNPIAGVTDNDFDNDSYVNQFDLDSDNDGLYDAIEAGLTDADSDGQVGSAPLVDANNNGWSDLSDGVLSSVTILNTDGNGGSNYIDLDSDNDGLLDIFEAGGTDADGNGVADGLGDTDNDGIIDIYDTNNGGTLIPNTNTDGDALPNYSDLDSDNDAIQDLVEAGGVDTDGNGLIDGATDSDNDGIIDDYDVTAGGVVISNLNTDGDALADYIDLDSDNDGIQDIIEAGELDADANGTVDGIVDVNANGWADAYDAGTPTAATGADTDNDGIPNSWPNGGATDNDFDNDSLVNSIDLDSDNDGIVDAIEAGLADVDGDGFVGTGLVVDANNNGWSDLGDGILTSVAILNNDADANSNYIDLDSDNDAIQDIVEAGGVDTDGNGVIDSVVDTDGDGLIDLYDLNAGGDIILNSNKDADALANYIDLDSDNDGIQDLVEVGELDTDGNGVVDAIVDANANGWADANDAGTPTAATGADTDADGIPNSLPTSGLTDNDFDNDTLENYLDLDSDNDGIADVIESGNASADTDLDAVITSLDVNGADANNNGWANATDDGLHTDATLVNTDAVIGPDYLDIDSDNDGIVDNIEGQNSVTILPGYVAPSFVDANKNGLDDIYENALTLGFNGIQPIDDADDADLIPDYIDTNTDGDAQTDDVEAFDIDGSNTLNGAEPVFAALDTDGDGLVDVYDLDNVNVNPTNETVPLTAGQTSNSFPNVDGGADRDWRNIENNKPLAVNDTVFTSVNETVPGGTANPGIVIQVQINDDDGDAGVVQILTTDVAGLVAPSHGTVTVLNNDSILYQPAADYCGVDSFQYAICDNGSLTKCDTAWIFVDMSHPDTDNDGLPNYFENASAFNAGDSDNDGVQDYLDLDSDNDGITDSLEAKVILSCNAPTPTDTDGDGKPDHIDVDSDNDGLTDAFEAGFAALDSDGNGVIDGADANSDGIVDASLGLVAEDNDGDLVPDHLDLDSDNDGLFDIVENGNASADINHDGTLSTLDAFYIDAEGDGLLDIVDGDATSIGDGANNQTIASQDNDGDASIDSEDLDADNDGLTDVLEAGLISLDVDSNGVVDGFDTDFDGIIDSLNAAILSIDSVSATFGGTPYLLESDSLQDNDDDGSIDSEDLDADNDGLNDMLEGGLSSLDTDLDGVIDNATTDADGDGLPDSSDGNATYGSPANPTQTLSYQDNDGDGSIDSEDLDADNDGLFDIVEGGLDTLDTNNDGVVNNANTDSDNDGIADAVDGNASYGDIANDNNQSDVTQDNDGDGSIDSEDLDADNDGIFDLIENGNNALDTDFDGVVNGTDNDNDGIIDHNGATVLAIDSISLTYGGTPDFNQSEGAQDADGDGSIDSEDLDSDDDSVNDIEEADLTGLDTDHNGVLDGTDSDNDGIIDLDMAGNSLSVDTLVGYGGTPIHAGQSNALDTDGDGTIDSEDKDADGDGLDDIDENGHEDLDADNNGVIDDITDADGDGIPNVTDGANGTYGDEPGFVGEEEADCDEDGIQNYMDPDPCDLNLPSGFSPNGDGVNDVYEIRGINSYKENKIMIFNRWGNVVFEMDNYDNLWNGYANKGVVVNSGEKVPAGTYYIVFEYFDKKLDKRTGKATYVEIRY